MTPQDLINDIIIEIYLPGPFHKTISRNILWYLIKSAKGERRGALRRRGLYCRREMDRFRQRAEEDGHRLGEILRAILINECVSRLELSAKLIKRVAGGLRSLLSLLYDIKQLQWFIPRPAKTLNAPRYNATASLNACLLLWACARREGKSEQVSTEESNESI